MSSQTALLESNAVPYPGLITTRFSSMEAEGTQKSSLVLKSFYQW